jgi:hypothetical protein
LVGGALLISLGSLISPPVLIIGVIVLLIAGFGVWFVIRRRQKPDAPLGSYSVLFTLHSVLNQR